MAKLIDGFETLFKDARDKFRWQTPGAMTAFWGYLFITVAACVVGLALLAARVIFDV